MTRVAILFSFLFAACDVGAVGAGPGSGSNPGGPDGGNGGGGDAAGATCANRATPIAAHTHAASGTDNAGQGCLNAGCHLQGGAGSQFQFAGTVYKTDGTTPNAGVTVKIQGANGPLNPPAITDAGGNFYVYAGTLPMAFPATVTASVCPAADKPMSAQVQSNGGGNCNNCHVTGGTTSPISIADQ